MRFPRVLACMLPNSRLGAFGPRLKQKNTKICKTLFALSNGKNRLHASKEHWAEFELQRRMHRSQEIITGCTHMYCTILFAGSSLTSPYPCKFPISFHQILIIFLCKVMLDDNYYLFYELVSEANQKRIDLGSSPYESLTACFLDRPILIRMHENPLSMRRVFG